MDVVPGLLSGVSTLILFCILGATLWKVVQISTEVHELKGMIQRRNAAVPQIFAAQPAASGAVPPLPAAHAGQVSPGPISPEDLVRAVHAQGYDAIVNEAEILPPRP